MALCILLTGDAPADVAEEVREPTEDDVLGIVIVECDGGGRYVAAQDREDVLPKRRNGRATLGRARVAR